VAFWNEPKDEGDKRESKRSEGGESEVYGMGSGHLVPFEICTFSGDFVYLSILFYFIYIYYLVHTEMTLHAERTKRCYFPN
jgi:hypothetical protein